MLQVQELRRALREEVAKREAAEEAARRLRFEVLRLRDQVDFLLAGGGHEAGADADSAGGDSASRASGGDASHPTSRALFDEATDNEEEDDDDDEASLEGAGLQGQPEKQTANLLVPDPAQQPLPSPPARGPAPGHVFSSDEVKSDSDVDLVPDSNSESESELESELLTVRLPRGQDRGRHSVRVTNTKTAADLLHEIRAAERAMLASPSTPVARARMSANERHHRRLVQLERERVGEPIPANRALAAAHRDSGECASGSGVAVAAAAADLSRRVAAELRAERAHRVQLLSRASATPGDTELLRLWSACGASFVERQRTLAQLDALGPAERQLYAGEQSARLAKRAGSAHHASAVSKQVRKLEDLADRETQCQLALGGRDGHGHGRGQGRLAGRGGGGSGKGKVGTQLLRLAAERKRVERVVRASVRRWEAEHGRDFVHRGLPYLALLEHRYEVAEEAHHADKLRRRRAA